MKRLLSYSIFSFISSFFVWSQSGQAVYSFLEIPFSSHVSALGGANVALRSQDVNFATGNPSLLSVDTDNQLALNFSNHIADVSLGSVVYGKNWKDNLLGFAIQYIDYGSFDGYSQTNQPMGSFTAKDFAVSFMYAKQLAKNWHGGIAVKPIYSAYENYYSVGIAVDMGWSYANEAKGLFWGMALQHIGTQVRSYAETAESLPYNSLLSFSKKFSHAPLRVSVTAHHLHVWNLGYTNTITTTTLSGEKLSESISFVDMLFRHAILGIDFVPSKSFYLTAGYNHQRAAELRVSGIKSIAGFSFGGGLKVSNFQLGFAAVQYQKGILSYQVSLNTKLNSFIKKHAAK